MKQNSPVKNTYGQNKGITKIDMKALNSDIIDSKS